MSRPTAIMQTPGRGEPVMTHQQPQNVPQQARESELDDYLAQPAQRTEDAYLDARLDALASGADATPLAHQPVRSACLDCFVPLPAGAVALCPGCTATRAVERARRERERIPAHGRGGGAS